MPEKKEKLMDGRGLSDAAFLADPFNKEELVHTLKGRELIIFAIFYIITMTMIVLMFEFFKPVLFNSNYPNEA